MQNCMRLIARLIVARHECTYVQHCKENARIYMYYLAPETPMISSVISDCTDLATPNILTNRHMYNNNHAQQMALNVHVQYITALENNLHLSGVKQTFILAFILIVYVKLLCVMSMINVQLFMLYLCEM